MTQLLAIKCLSDARSSLEDGTFRTGLDPFDSLALRTEKPLTFEIAKRRVRENSSILNFDAGLQAATSSNEAAVSFSLERILEEQIIGLKEDLEEDSLDTKSVLRLSGIAISHGCYRLGIPTAYTFDINDKTLLPQEIAEQLWNRRAEFGMKVLFRGEPHVVADLTLIKKGSPRIIPLSEAAEEVAKAFCKLFMEYRRCTISLTDIPLMLPDMEGVTAEGIQEWRRLRPILRNDSWSPNHGDIIPQGCEFAHLILIDSRFIS